MKAADTRFMHKLLSIWLLAATGLTSQLQALEKSGLSHDDLRAIHRINELNCAACHAPTEGALIKKSPAPVLDSVGSRINPGYIEQFLLNPQGTKPGTSMPDVLATLPDKERQPAAIALTHYLSSLGERRFAISSLDASRIEVGHETFHSVGCVACHNPREKSSAEKQLPDSTPLGDLRGKYSVASLTAFLLDPLSIRPGGRMPDLHLSEQEASDISQFLLQGQVPARAPVFVPDPALVKKGERLFTTMNCVQCHDASSKPSSIPFDKLRAGKGCLSPNHKASPRYALSRKDHELFGRALDALAFPTDRDRIQLTLMQHNCIACHQRGEMGGVSEDRDPYFETSQPNLGNDGRIPPDLNLVGARLTEEWLNRVILGGEKIRPYMKTRMPVFGDHNVGHLAALLKKTDRLPAIEELPESGKDLKKQFRQQGEQLMGVNFACYTCHTFKGKAGGDIKGLDLYTTVNRLEKDYFYHFMMDPQKFKSGIIMPSFFPEGRSPFHDIFEGDARKQIEAMWTFLNGDFYYYPKGLTAEKTLVEGRKDEAVILRRKFRGLNAHRRGIAVAYPNGMNLAFNAQEPDVFMMWKNDFLDATPAFTRQGEGPVSALGELSLKFPQGPSIWTLEKDKPWPKDITDAPGYRFRGYTLDELKRPTFLYEYHDLTVQDFFADVGGHTAFFRRTIRLSTDEKLDGLYLRVGRGKDITKTASGHYVIDGILNVKVKGTGEAELLPAEKGQQDLTFQINAFKGVETLSIEYLWEDPE